MATQNTNPPISHASSDSVNGRNPTVPAIPMNGNSFTSDHKRTPSMTVTPAGTTSFNPNGPPQNKAANVQFGSLNNGSNVSPSPAMATPQLSHTQSASLGVNNLAARMSSPSGSPSPIPQPVQLTGGRPPSGMEGPQNGMKFGQFSNDQPDVNGMTRSLSNMQMSHDRRPSQQSAHGNAPHDLPTGPGRGGYGNRGGRGGYGGQYNNHTQYNPNNSGFRPNQHNNRGGYQGRGGHNMPFQGSPSMQPRQPMMNPGTPTMATMQMAPGMQQIPYGGYHSYPAAYGQVPIAADPSISYNAQQYQGGFYPGQYPQGPPQSPRPFYQQTGYGGQGMQQQFSNQGQMPTSMSRQSSQVSAIERPGSSIGQTPQTPAAALHHASQRTPSVSGEKNFIAPAKKSSAIVIKNAQGEVVDFSKKKESTTPVVASSTPTAPTPPSRTGSAVSAAHNRTESQTVKPDQDQDQKKKAMQEAVARKIAADKEQEAEQLRKQKQAEEEKAQMEAEAKAAAEREAAEKKAEAERLEKEAAAAKEAEEAAKAAAAEPAKTTTAEDDEFERMIAEMERKAAEEEAEEARREEEYQKKKAAEKEAQRKKEEEEAAAYEANMKELERQAEEAELAREKKRAEGTSDDEAKKMFAALKGGEPSESQEVSPVATPAESGTATPLSEISMGPPVKGLGGGRRGKPEQLTLDTKKSTEPPEPSATLKALTSARKLADPSKVEYPSGIVSPNPALNANAPADRKFKYNKEFLLQFQNVFKEKPSLDWDQKIREALGHDDTARPQTARTPSGMGTRSASNRGVPPNAFGGAMGQFGGGPVRTLPPGTTSDQRFAASTAAMRGGPMGSNPFAMGRPGSMGPPMGRTPSNNPLAGLPGSPRVGGASRGGSRAESKRAKQSAKQEAEANKSMPLTAGMSVGTLETSASGWKARSVGQTPSSSVGPDGYMEADVVQRKVKAALNKMTPEKFDRISDQVLEIAAQSKNESDGRTLRQVIQLVFEKATDEAHWASMYAKFCYKMLSTMSPEIKDEGIKDKNGNVVTGGNLFRKYLLNRCQEEFEKGWKVNLPPKKEGETEEAAMLSDEYYQAMAAKRRGLGLVKFIGELFKLGMLTERIMHECVKKLLDYEGTPDEAEVESLSSLLRTIGKQLDSSESKAAGRMDAYFERINQTMSLPDLPSRLKFMLLDIVDLRKAGWASKDADKGPKTIQQIHEEAEAAKAQEEMQRLASQANARGGGRMPLGRGDARSFSGYGQVPPPDNSNRVGADDLRRLGGRNRTSTPSGSFGPSGLGARTNSGRRGLGPSLRADDSANTSRTGTPPASTKKDESSTNAFSALAGLGDNADGPTSPPSNPSSPPTQQSQPLERERSRSSEKKQTA